MDDRLYSANDNVVKVFAQTLERDLMSIIKVWQHFHPNTVRHAYFHAVFRQSGERDLKVFILDHK